MLEINNLKIEWLGHATVRITSNKTIYIDPFNLTTDQKADLILITHGHYDHCSVADIRKILKPTTIIFAPPDCSSKLAKLNHPKIQIIAPGKKASFDTYSIETIPAYNLNKNFHPIKINIHISTILCTSMSGNPAPKFVFGSNGLNTGIYITAIIRRMLIHLKSLDATPLDFILY